MPKPPRLTLSYRVALLIAVLLVSSAVITILFSLRSVETTMTTETQQSAENIHASVNGLISLEYEGIVDYRATALECRKTELRNLTDALATGLDGIRASAGRGELTADQARANGQALVKSIRFGNDDYFYAFDRSMTAIAHPDPAIEDRNLIDLQDADGKLFVRDLQRVALGDGSGFVDYRWNRLGQTDPSAKLAYVFHYEPWDWIIGTGVYVDDIDSEVAQRTEVIKSQLTSTLDSIHFSNGGFFFILNGQGEVAVAPSDHDLSGLSSTAGGQQFVEQVIAAAPDSEGEIGTVTADVALGSSQAQAWVLNASTFPALDWYLVSAVPESDLVAPGRTLVLQQAGLTLIVLLIGLAAGLLLSRRIIRPVETITKAARDLSTGEFDSTSLDGAAHRTDEVGELARTFQRMGVEIMARERRLREQVARLRVEIDHSTREDAVREVTETEFFADLKAKAAEMRRRLHEDPPE